jgi:hypothetical protein
LDEAEDPVGDDDDDDEDGVDRMTGPDRKDGRSQQHPDEDAVELRDEDG